MVLPLKSTEQTSVAKSSSVGALHHLVGERPEGPDGDTHHIVGQQGKITIRNNSSPRHQQDTLWEGMVSAQPSHQFIKGAGHLIDVCRAFENTNAISLNL